MYLAPTLPLGYSKIASLNLLAQTGPVHLVMYSGWLHYTILVIDISVWYVSRINAHDISLKAVAYDMLPESNFTLKMDTV